MIESKISNLYGKYLSWGAALISVIVTPYYSFESFNVPKLLILSGVGTVSLLYIFLEQSKLKKYWPKWYKIIILIMLIDALLILIFRKNSFTDSLFGVDGRNTGFIAFMSFLLIFIGASLASSHRNQKLVLSAIATSGTLSIIYSLIQMSGNDPFPWAGQTASRVIGFLGNPNFQSAFMAIVGIVSFAKILDTKIAKAPRFVSILIFMGSVLGLKGANATQGFLIFGIGIGFIIFIYLRSSVRTKKISWVFLTLGIFGGISALLDIFQKAPWKPFLYSETVSFRGDFWQAGWNMTKSNPLFGVGFDGYGNFYRRSRSIVASSRYAADTPTNAAHNIFLDYSSNGGFVFLILNLIIIFIVLGKIVMRFKSNPVYEYSFVAISAAWLAFIAQGIVSINQIGLAIWGWVLGGLILGSALNIDYEGKSGIRKSNESHSDNGYGIFSSSAFVLFLLGCMVSLPVLLSDHAFKHAIDTRKAGDLLKSAETWPRSPKRMALVAGVLTENHLAKESLMLTKMAINESPDNFELWKIHATNPFLTPGELSEAKQQLARLDPNLLKLGGVDKYLIESTS